MKKNAKKSTPETTTPATAPAATTPSPRPAPSARATLYRIASLCAAAEKRLPQAEDRAALLALYLAAVRDATRDFWTTANARRPGNLADPVRVPGLAAN